MRSTLYFILAGLLFASCTQGMKNGNPSTQNGLGKTGTAGSDQQQQKGGSAQNKGNNKAVPENNLLNAFTKNQVNSDLVPFRNAKNPNEKEAETLYNSGTVKAKNGNYSDAISDFSSSIKLSPYGNTYLRRGYAYLMLKQYDLGIQDMNIAAKLLPTPELAWFARGICYFEKEEFDSAEVDIQNYVGREKSNPIAYNYMAAIRFMKQDIKGALDNYEMVARLNPDFPDIYTNRGMMHHYLNDLKAAVDDYNEAIKRDPHNATAFNNRGAAKLYQKDYTGAIEDFNEAIQLNNGYADAYDNRGRAKLNLGKTEEACQDWKKAYSLGLEKTSELIDKYCK